MKNIMTVIIVCISLIMCFAILRNTKERYKIVMDGEGSVTLKYDVVSGETWRLVFPDNYWVGIPDPGRVFNVPGLDEKN